MMKRIMTGKRFAMILKGLHLCPVDGGTGDPGYKTKEFFTALEERYNDLYEPGQSLSLDESLIRAFGRMKFKV